MFQMKLPLFPPRKARNSSYLINFVVRFLDYFKPFDLKLPSRTKFQSKAFWKVLISAAIQKTSISRKSRDLREIDDSIPSGETVIRQLSQNIVDELNQTNQYSFLHFLKCLPTNFQQARKRGICLALDFHCLPNYTKNSGNFICKGRRKSSTNQFYQYITLLWINAPEPLTLGCLLVSSGHSITKVTQQLLAPLINSENIDCVLADVSFYRVDLIDWFQRKKIFFIIRGHHNSGTKPLLTKYGSKLLVDNMNLIVD